MTFFVTLFLYFLDGQFVFVFLIKFDSFDDIFKEQCALFIIYTPLELTCKMILTKQRRFPCFLHSQICFPRASFIQCSICFLASLSYPPFIPKVSLGKNPSSFTNQLYKLQGLSSFRSTLVFILQISYAPKVYTF